MYPNFGLTGRAVAPGIFFLLISGMGWWQGVLLRDHTFLLSSTVALVGVSSCGAGGVCVRSVYRKGLLRTHVYLCRVVWGASSEAVVGGCWDGGSDGFFDGQFRSLAVDVCRSGPGREWWSRSPTSCYHHFMTLSRCSWCQAPLV